MAHRIHTVSRVPGRSGSSTGPIKIVADDKLPEQIGFVYEELTDWTNQFREEIADLQERVRELEQRKS